MKCDAVEYRKIKVLSKLAVEFDLRKIRNNVLIYHFKWINKPPI